ncbi:CADD family putative folate metabolism protein [Candidatus Woesearchaeota archaeon]|nr:CADD family putative folate metabolism protein [Candidatus Woesearchaeota archaeon]
MQESTAFIQQLQTEIDKKHLLKHPFYQAWENGTLPVTVMQKYAQQYYHLERNFPIFLSLMHSGCEIFEVRQAITDNLYDEEHGEKNHTELWMRFGEAIGAKRGEIKASNPLPETQHAVDTFKKMSASSFLEGSGCLAAYESQIPAVAEKKLHGLEKNYGIHDTRGTEFFQLHGVLDVKHANVWWDIISEHANTPERQLAVMEAVKNGRDSLWGFLDGVCRAYGTEDMKKMC